MENVINKVVLSGIAGADAELKTVGNNQKLAKVSMAINESYKTANGQEQTKTSWFNLTFWNQLAEQAHEKIKKGTKFSIAGRLQNNSYETAEGQKRYVTEIIVTELVLKEEKVEA